MTGAVRFWLVLMICLVASVQQVSARCMSAGLVVNPDASAAKRSFVSIPGVCITGDRYVCEGGPHYGSLTGSLEGAFWALGHGDPRSGHGIDNGTFVPGYPGPNFPEILHAPGDPQTWVHMPTYHRARIVGSWASHSGIDGCPDTIAGPDCTAVMLSDTRDDEGYFALVATPRSDTNGGLIRVGGEPIRLARLPAPRLDDLEWVDDSTIRLAVRPPFDDDLDTSDGVYLDPRCEFGAPVRWIVLRQTVEGHDRDPPAKRDVSEWQSLGPPGLLDGSSRPVELTCLGDQDIYLSYSLMFDSGYELAYVSANSRRVECGPNARADSGWAPLLRIAGRGLVLLGVAAGLWAIGRRLRRGTSLEKARIRRRAFAVVTLVGTTGICLLIAESAFRRWGDPWPYREFGSIVGIKAHGRWNEYLPSVTGPLMEFRRRTDEYDVIYRTNEEGFRDDRPLPAKKPAGERRVLVCGDSFTWGEGAQFADTYGEVAERRLNAGGSSDFRVINAGYRSGYTVDHYLAFLEREADRWQPDDIVVQIYTGNDLVDIEDNRWEQIDDRGLATVIRTIRRWTDHEGRFVDARHYDPYLPQWLRDSSLAVSASRAITGRYAVLEPMAPQLAEQRLAMVIRAIDEYASRTNRGMIWILVPSRNRDARHLRSAAIVRATIEELGAELIDLELVIESSGRPFTSYFYPRDGHLNDSGNRLLGEQLALRIGGGRDG